MHFFNPAPVMPLVEVIAGEHSAAANVDAAYQAAKSWGKIPVRAKDTPGFIVNRVARGFYLEAMRLLGEGVAGIDEIDHVVKTRGGFRMGPFELMDLVGLDVNLAVSTSVWQQMGKPARFAPHEIQQSLVTAGHLGRKTGRGFYSYKSENRLPAFPVSRQSFEVNLKLGDALHTFCAKAGVVAAGSTEQYVFSRILCAIINEAGFAWDAGVATSDDIDIAMQKGTNYPRGPLAWADAIGGRNVRGALRALNALVDDDRYEPARLFANAD
jgi:3-hydroxybutyryl-CoA dehydrogenase